MVCLLGEYWGGDLRYRKPAAVAVDTRSVGWWVGIDASKPWVQTKLAGTCFCVTAFSFPNVDKEQKELGELGFFPPPALAGGDQPPSAASVTQWKGTEPPASIMLEVSCGPNALFSDAECEAAGCNHVKIVADDGSLDGPGKDLILNCEGHDLPIILWMSLPTSGGIHKGEPDREVKRQHATRIISRAVSLARKFASGGERRKVVFEWPRACDYPELPVYKRALRQLGALSVNVNACAVGVGSSAQVWRVDSPPGGVLGSLTGLRCRPEWGHCHASETASADLRAYPPLFKKKVLAAWQASVNRFAGADLAVACCAPDVGDPDFPGPDPEESFPVFSQRHTLSQQKGAPAGRGGMAGNPPGSAPPVGRGTSRAHAPVSRPSAQFGAGGKGRPALPNVAPAGPSTPPRPWPRPSVAPTPGAVLSPAPGRQAAPGNGDFGSEPTGERPSSAGSPASAALPGGGAPAGPPSVLARIGGAPSASGSRVPPRLRQSVEAAQVPRRPRWSEVEPGRTGGGPCFMQWTEFAEMGEPLFPWSWGSVVSDAIVTDRGVHVWHAYAIRAITAAHQETPGGLGYFVEFQSMTTRWGRPDCRIVAHSYRRAAELFMLTIGSYGLAGNGFPWDVEGLIKLFASEGPPNGVLLPPARLVLGKSHVQIYGDFAFCIKPTSAVNRGYRPLTAAKIPVEANLNVFASQHHGVTAMCQLAADVAASPVSAEDVDVGGYKVNPAYPMGLLKAALGRPIGQRIFRWTPLALTPLVRHTSRPLSKAWLAGGFTAETATSTCFGMEGRTSLTGKSLGSNRSGHNWCRLSPSPWPARLAPSHVLPWC